jgi:hypothetical protein
MKKTTSESFIKSSCFFYSSGCCAIMKGAKEGNKLVKVKCKPASLCMVPGKEIKEFVDSIRVPDIEFTENVSVMSRYVS